MRGRPSPVDLERRLEADADRRHHSRRAPEERDEEEKPERGQGRRDLLDRAPHVLLARRVRREDGEQFVDHPRAKRVVLQHEPEDGDEQDHEREEREEHVEGNRSRVLRAAVAKEILDREREHDEDSEGRVHRPADDAHDPPVALHGWGVAHRLSVGACLERSPTLT